MEMNRRFLAGLLVFAGVLLGSESSQAVTQTLTFNATSDNAYAIYTGTATSATQNVGGASNFLSSSEIFAPESYTTSPQEYDPFGAFIYIAAWSDGQVAQGLLVDYTHTYENGLSILTLSGDYRWSVAVTGISLPPGSPAPTLEEITTQIGLANNPNAYGWKGITKSTLGNVSGGIHDVAVAGFYDSSHWMWWNSGNQGGETAPFSPGFNHGEYLIFRLPLNTTGLPPKDPVENAVVPTLPEWATIIMATLLMGVAVRAQARNRV